MLPFYSKGLDLLECKKEKTIVLVPIRCNIKAWEDCGGVFGKPGEIQKLPKLKFPHSFDHLTGTCTQIQHVQTLFDRVTKAIGDLSYSSTLWPL